MRILVLGSDGQIGYSLVQHLRKDNEVFEFDIFSNPINDLRFPNILDRKLEDIDFVFFLAFDVGGSVYLKKYEHTIDFISNNIKIMNNTFDSLRKFNTPFIFASSQMSGMIHSSYGLLKRIGEMYTHCLNGKIAKLWNVYGRQVSSIKNFVITDFISMAKHQGRIDMQTTGEESRQFLYVEDCCECLSILMNKFNELDSNEYDVSSFEWITIKDVAYIIADNFNDCNVFTGDKVDDVQRNALNDPRTDILKYWQPRTPIEVGIKHLIDD